MQLKYKVLGLMYRVARVPANPTKNMVANFSFLIYFFLFCILSIPPP